MVDVKLTKARILQMSSMLRYKNYIGSIEFSEEDDILYGKVLGINSLLSYEGNTVKELKADFEGVIDDYLELCAKQGKEPEMAFKGSFNVRIDPKLHKKLFLLAKRNHTSINSIVEDAIEKALA